MNELQAQANAAFQPFSVEDHGYTFSDSSLASPTELVAQSETESSNSVITAVMVIEATNVEEQLTNMKAILERLVKESLEKDAQIKHQSESIAALMKKLEKRPLGSSTKGSNGKESNKEPNRSEDFDDKHINKKESSLGSMSVE